MLRGSMPLLLVAMAAAGGCTPVRAPAVPYACEGGVRMEVRFERDHALLSLPGGGRVPLAQQLSGSGFWYAGQGHVLRGRGREMQWGVGDAAPVACLVIGP